MQLVLNVALSDGLHNLDRHLGSAYVRKADVIVREQTLHARDWRAALAVPASYHVLLIFGIGALACLAKDEPQNRLAIATGLVKLLHLEKADEPEEVNRIMAEFSSAADFKAGLAAVVATTFAKEGEGVAYATEPSAFLHSASVMSRLQS